MSLFQRVASWLANEIVVKSLAKAQWFQRFAQSTHKHVSKLSEEGAKHAEKLKSVEENAAKVLSSTESPLGRVRTFGSSFMRNLKENYKALEEEGRRLEEMERKSRGNK
eukprot:TRINITY_DN7965_c0_g1_i3.p1 TRINITY_DN7965_c0_g1~~TRINITY_DN7965_c0_g1_i3.p1  ORF type:complete len:109 (+),score=18.73 TRINITY_DN7965_c0_g1_i3:88-414(+)